MHLQLKLLSWPNLGVLLVQCSLLESSMFDSTTEQAVVPRSILREDHVRVIASGSEIRSRLASEGTGKGNPDSSKELLD